MASCLSEMCSSEQSIMLVSKSSQRKSRSAYNSTKSDSKFGDKFYLN